MFPHPLRNLLLNLYTSIPNPFSRTYRFSYTKTPPKSSFSSPCSTTLGPKTSYPNFLLQTTTNKSVISSNHSKTTIHTPSLLFSIKHLCTTSNNVHETTTTTTTTSISDKVYEIIMSSYSSNQSMEEELTSLAPQLTTELVNDVLHKLRYEEKLAFWFFTWAGHHDGVRDPKKAMAVLEEMLERGHIPESFTYNAAISTFCEAGLIKEARELFEFMRTKGSTISSPTAKTYSVMIVCLAKYDGMMDECFNLLREMRDCGCLPDVSTYIDLIEGMCLAGKIDAAHKILEEMGKTSYPPDILTYNCFLKVLCRMKKHEESLRLCEKMIEGGCEPSVHTYNMMITMFFEIGDSDRAFDIWLEMDKRGCERSVDTYGIMIDGLFGCGRVEDACFLLDKVIDQGMKLPYKQFDALLLRLSEIGNLRAIHRLSDHMKRFYNVVMARRFAKSQKKKSISMRRP